MGATCTDRHRCGRLPWAPAVHLCPIRPHCQLHSFSHPSVCSCSPWRFCRGSGGGCLPLSTHAGLSNHPGSLPGPLVMCELVALGDEVHFRSSHEMFRKLLSCAGEW